MAVGVAEADAEVEAVDGIVDVGVRTEVTLTAVDIVTWEMGTEPEPEREKTVDVTAVGDEKTVTVADGAEDGVGLDCATTIAAAKRPEKETRQILLNNIPEKRGMGG
jgi:hypothetical protein